MGGIKALSSNNETSFQIIKQIQNPTVKQRMLRTFCPNDSTSWQF